MAQSLGVPDFSQPDQYGSRWLRYQTHERAIILWYAPRNSYCDRGHWELHCEGCWNKLDHGLIDDDVFQTLTFSCPVGINDIDQDDCFPRYFCSERNLLDEALRFVIWRIHKIRFPE